MDRAGWHSTDKLKVPKNITIKWSAGHGDDSRNRISATFAVQIDDGVDGRLSGSADVGLRFGLAPGSRPYCMHTFFIVFRLRDFLVFDSV